MLLRCGLLALALLGCGQVSRIAECRRFVSLANPTLAELRALDEPNQVVPEAANYDRLAQRFDRFATEIDTLRVRDTRLLEAVGGVRITMKTAADDCRQYAQELREHDALQGEAHKVSQLNVRRKLKKTRTRVSAALRQYKTQVARVNSVCQPQ
jgi:hypothetical protein